MKLNALLMCRDQRSLRILAQALEEVGIEAEVCLAADDATERLVGGRYSAVVLDFDLAGAVQVAGMARLAPPQQRPVVFAMLGSRTHVAATLQAGANFVLYKPLDHGQIMRSLRAAKCFMRPDRRRETRLKLETLVYLQFGVAAMPALVLDITEQGLSLQAAEPLPPVQSVPIRFVLPGTPHMVEAQGEMVWADDEGRAGLFFSQMAAASKKHLKAWLTKRSPKKRSSRAVVRKGKARVAAAAN